MMGFVIFDLNASGKNILSIILLIPTTILNTEMNNPIKIGENHVPNVAPIVK